MGVVTVGLDVGQRRDPTAIAVVEQEARTAGGRREAHHVVRHLERLALGTSYPDVARRVAAVCAGVVARIGQAPVLYADATGVGTPLIDVLREAGVAASLRPVYFTHGDRRTETWEQVALGKAWLVSRLKTLFQTGRIHLPPGHPEAVAMERELLAYEIRIDEQANDRYGAFAVGAHDDLVTAVGLAVQVEADPGRFTGLAGGDTTTDFWTGSAPAGGSDYREITWREAVGDWR